MVKAIKKFLKEEDGLAMPEYALMVALIAGIAYVAAETLGNAVNTKYDQTATVINSKGPTLPGGTP